MKPNSKNTRAGDPQAGLSRDSAPAPSASADRPEGLPQSASNEEIARRAYARWESSDGSHGRDQEHWLAAENELRSGGDRARNDSASDRAQGDETEAENDI